jgi:NTP pyrophosphatase (non-canonical NTP hydrolase)
MRQPCWRNGFVEPEESKGKDDKMNKQPTIEEVYKRPEYFDAVCSKSIEHYGVTKQSIVCMEECAELIEAYNDRKRDGLTDETRSHMVEEMADVLICLWLLEHMYDIKGRDIRTYHPSPVGACAALIKAVSKILRYGTEEERLDGLADAVEDVRRWLMLLETENGITDEELNEWVERKTVRQQRRNATKETDK